MKFFNTLTALILLLSSIVSTQGQNNNIELLGQLKYEVSLNDIWGYETEGKEYALVGLYDALSIVDVTDAENPVEVDKISGPRSTWRDIKTFDHYAYVTHDFTDGDDPVGCLIVDLQYLPDSTVTYYFTGDSDENFSTAHNVFIDELGILYIIGADNSEGGCLMYDLNEDPTQPKFVGKYDEAYVHDAYVRDNILYTSESNTGQLAIVDIKDKSNPTVLGSATSYGITHNCWLSDDAKTLYTTDETGGTWIVSWDISDPADIKELHRWQSSPGEGVIPHNTFVRGDFLITSYYTDGVTITNVKDPSIMVQVGNYDTSPEAGGGFNGCWGVYPYLPSTNIIASDIEEGLFILKPTYTDAAYLNGVVVDAESGDPVFDAAITIDNLTIISDLNGEFSHGNTGQETFSIIVSKFGYETDTLTDIKLTLNEITELRVELTQKPRIYNIVANLIDAEDNSKVNNGIAILNIEDINFDYKLESGELTIDSLYVGDYTATFGAWGYIPVEVKFSAAIATSY